MICTNEFSMLRRRHHCRACGKVDNTVANCCCQHTPLLCKVKPVLTRVDVPLQVVCNACSPEQVELLYLGNEIGRVCEECYTAWLKLQETRGRQGTNSIPVAVVVAPNFDHRVTHSYATTS
jgi:hypothetical protein